MQDINEGLEDISPTSRLFLTQQMFEPLLRKHAVEHGADLRFSTELVDFQQDDSGVTALIQNTETGAKQLVRAQYMVACDGNRSFVREKLGIRMQGHGLLSRSITIYFKADLGRFVKGKYNGVIYVNNKDIRGFFRLDKTGREGFLVINTAGEQGTEESRFPADGITNERAADILRAAIGADVDFEITLLSPWRAVCDVAERFQDGRILLAGDAAHTVTPHGGFGGNTGIQDAHNLAWKLALVLQQKAGSELVQSYHIERFPVAKKTVDQVFVRYLTRTAPELKTSDIEVEDEVPEPHLELGYQYHSRALTTTILPDGKVTSDPRSSNAKPGTMAHHVWITTSDEESSFPIADLLGHTFILVAGHEAIGWVRAARNYNAESGNLLPPLTVHQLGTGNETFYKKYQLSPAGSVLIRPDGFVAWSENNAAIHGFGGIGMPGPEDRLKCVMKDILCITDSKQLHQLQKQPPGKAVHANSAALFIFREIQDLTSKKAQLIRQMSELDTRLADLERMNNLEDEMAMLGMKLKMAPSNNFNVQQSEQPPQYDLGPG